MCFVVYCWLFYVWRLNAEGGVEFVGEDLGTSYPRNLPNTLTPSKPLNLLIFKY